MPTGRKITMKEMKHDRFVEGVISYGFRGWVWLQDNLRTVGLVAGGLVVAGVLVLAWFSWSARQEKEARAALALALQNLPAELQAPGASPDPAGTEEGDLQAAEDQLTALRESHGGTEAGRLAGYWLAVVRLENGRAEPALEAARAFLDSAPNHRLAPLALWVQARAEARLGKSEEALESYRRLEEMEGVLLAPPLARLYHGQYLERLGRTREALEIYRDLAGREEEGTWKAMATQKVEELTPLVEAGGDAVS